MGGKASALFAAGLLLLSAGGEARAEDPPAPAPSATAAAESSRMQELKATFKTFIESWMEKLRARERHNIATIEWKPGSSGVVGEYVGYDTSSYQIAGISNPDAAPIGRVVYMELKLRLSGASEVDALAQKPEIVEQTEVTELFRFDRGSWVY